MSSVVISGDTSGAVTVSAPAVAGTNTLTLQAATATNAVNTLGTAVASTSGTAIDFTNIPSWVKRITVMFSGVSTGGTSNLLVQIGSGSVTTSGYISSSTGASASVATVSSTSGFVVRFPVASYTASGIMTISLITANTYVQSHTLKLATTDTVFGGGDIALGGALDRVRITSVTPDTFDAGTINLLLEG
jgi:hypothetical protein